MLKYERAILVFVMCFITFCAGLLTRDAFAKAQLRKAKNTTESIVAESGKLRKVFGTITEQVNGIEIRAEEIAEGIRLSIDETAELGDVIGGSIDTLSRLDRTGDELINAIRFSQFYYSELKELIQLIIIADQKFESEEYLE